MIIHLLVGFQLLDDAHSCGGVHGRVFDLDGTMMVAVANDHVWSKQSSKGVRSEKC
jgi:hypothetical protein